LLEFIISANTCKPGVFLMLTRRADRTRMCFRRVRFSLFVSSE
jgi:hypothetical protein